MSYVLGIDQSTQGTKVILFDSQGKIVRRVDRAHRQIVNEQGWVSHDPQEIYTNLIEGVANILLLTGIDKSQLSAVGISNQRETAVAWDEGGKPLDNAVVWQCARSKPITDRLAEYADMIYERTGLPLSPYFPAGKMAWLLENTEAGDGKIHLGTMDSWLVYKLTRGKSFKTDYSNASRTQLFNLHSLSWDGEICGLFGIDPDMLPKVCDSNSCFGYTDFEGILDQPIPIQSVLGDSHGALFGQGCHRPGMVKTTYGTGSSIMMNTGETCVRSKYGLASSLAWCEDGRVEYVLEGNINYTGAVISWLKDDMGLISKPSDAEYLAAKANPEDTTVLVPAFTGLSAPYWKGNAKALITGMSRTTGRAEVVKAGLESIAYQINDVLRAMEQDCGQKITELRVDGGPTKNGYLMQFQSDLGNVDVCAAENEELSAMGAAYMAGIAAGIYDKTVFDNLSYRRYRPQRDDAWRRTSLERWKKSVDLVL